MNLLQQVNALGQSIWYDNIERNMLGVNGTLATLVRDDDLRGVTSNPAIFEKAIAHSSDYDTQLNSLKGQGLSAREVFYALAVKDIQSACDLLLPVYQRTHKTDGYVSLEVSPDLAFDVVGTIKEAKKLWGNINRKNAMIKVPATIEGIEAMAHLISEGINVNVTLIFSVPRYLRVLNGYIEGLERRVAKGLDISGIASVASFFVSRIDVAIDALLSDEGKKLKGKIAIANSQKAYQEYLTNLVDPRFMALKKRGAHPQRLLWASTGVKNPNYSDVLYMDALIGVDTVNTVPPATYGAFKDHGRPALSIMDGMEHMDAYLKQLETQGISLEVITKQLEKEGLMQFENAFHSLLQVIETRLNA